MGVWIETLHPGGVLIYGVSHPVWVCGLKLGKSLISLILHSHTLYGCVDWNNKLSLVMISYMRHTLYGCVDWNTLNRIKRRAWISHTLYGCVDWNSLGSQEKLALASHTLYGCVDWNTARFRIIGWRIQSHPVWVCGLKHHQKSEGFRLQGSHPVWVCGLKHKAVLFLVSSYRHTLYGCVDWNWLSRSS